MSVGKLILLGLFCFFAVLPSLGYITNRVVYFIITKRWNSKRKKMDYVEACGLGSFVFCAIFLLIAIIRFW